MSLRLALHEITELRHQGLRTLVYAGRRRADGVAVMIKTPRSPQPTRADVTRLVAEYEIGRSVEHAAVVGHLALDWHGHRPALVLEDFGGRSLVDGLSQSLPLSSFLEIALQLAEGLSALHDRGIIHKDINPANIIHNSSTGQTKITDFSIATVLDREALRNISAEHLEGTLPYISPEQTGRMNRSIDCRTDFYSLGVTLFQLLCGRLPFDSTDAVELVHAHIARTPPQPSELNPRIPDAVSGILTKLLCKAAEDRYQTAQGLIADLQRCRDEWGAHGEVGSFALGEHDVSARFRIPERLYGRQRPLDKLMEAFARVAEGSRELAVIAGQAGVGKSALVREMQRPVVKRRGFFVTGKFDQLQRDIPHSAFLEAVGELVRQLLTQGESEVALWRERLARASGEAGQVLVNALPEVELLIGPQAAVATLPPVEAEHRFNRLIRRFFRELAGADHPLVIFLADLQWADSASLHLIELLLADDDVHHLLLIGAYRQDVVDATHPLWIMMDAMRDGPAAVHTMKLSPLQPGHIAKLLADALRSEVEQVQALSELVHQRTLGNPLFVHQFLSSLHLEGLLTFDHRRRGWTWDQQQIEDHRIADDVATFLLGRMERLPLPTQHVVELAACIGARFDLGTISIIAEKPLKEVADLLRPALEAGVVRALDSGMGRLLVSGRVAGCDREQGMCIACAFVHDRVQQAAYARIPAERRQSLHLRLGRLLHEHLGPERLHERLFEVVNHFVASGDALTDGAERLQVAQLNLTAGRKAKAAAAYEAARRHFAAGIDLLPPDCWEHHHALAFELKLQLYECLLVERETSAETLALGEELLAKAQTRVERNRALTWHVIQLARFGEPERALDLGLQALREVGLELNPPDVDAAVCQGYARLRERLGEQCIADLANLPLMTAEQHVTTLDLVRTTLMPMFMRRRALVPLAEMATIRLSLDHGNGPLSGMAYAGYARVVGHIFGDYVTAYEFAQLGKVVSDATGVFRAGTRGLASALIDWLRDPLPMVVERLRAAFRMGVETGEPVYPALSASFLSSLAFEAGAPLDGLYDECARLERFISEQLGDIGMREVHITQRVIEALRGQRPWQTAVFADTQEESRALAVMRIRNPEGALWYHLQASRLAFLFAQYEASLQMAERAYAYADRNMGVFPAYDLVFQHGLALAATLDPAPGGESETNGAVGRLKELLATLKQWVDSGAGANLEHKYLLVKAEVARLSGDVQTAGPAYEQAVEAAGAVGFLHDQAMANELAARFYRSRGLEKVSRVYLNDARYGYEKWGASAKLSQLTRCHPGLAETNTSEHMALGQALTESQTVMGTTSTQGHWLDFATAIKAARAISREIVLDSLLQTLLSVVAENAGAERALLVLRRDGQLVVEAASEAGQQQVQLVGGQPLQQAEGLSAGIVNYVARTQQAVVLDDAVRKGMFRTDPYVSARHPRSVLCAPLATQGKLVGAVYLENNLISGAFSSQRLEMVDVLCGHAAISIEQARLYEELERTNRQLADYSRTLEQRVDQRTRDLAEKNSQLNGSLEQLRQVQNQLLLSEKMASLGNLVAGLAHEINTPVGAVVSSVDTAVRCLVKLRETIDEAASLQEVQGAQGVTRLLDLLGDSTRVIGTAGERVSEIVRTLRSFARLDEAERKPADLHEGLEGTLTLARHRLKQGIDVVTDYGTLPVVHCYPNQINQVFMNLLTNAMDAIEGRFRNAAGSAEHKGTITLRTWAADDLAYVQVLDDGEGIAPQHIGRIFDPGYTTKGVRVGTGLGLSICFKIIEGHGGTIDVHSTPGQGSTFTVAIPIMPAAVSE